MIFRQEEANDMEEPTEVQIGKTIMFLQFLAWVQVVWG